MFTREWGKESTTTTVRCPKRNRRSSIHAELADAWNQTLGLLWQVLLLPSLRTETSSKRASAFPPGCDVERVVDDQVVEQPGQKHKRIAVLKRGGCCSLWNGCGSKTKHERHDIAESGTYLSKRPEHSYQVEVKNRWRLSHCRPVQVAIQDQSKAECAHYGDEEEQAASISAQSEMAGSGHEPGCQNSGGSPRKRKPSRLVERNAAIAEMGWDVFGERVSRLQRKLLLRISHPILGARPSECQPTGPHPMSI